MGRRRSFGFDLSVLTCKVFGILIFAFCIGTLAGMFLPLGFVALTETVLLVALAYLCLFRW